MSSHSDLPEIHVEQAVDIPTRDGRCVRLGLETFEGHSFITIGAHREDPFEVELHDARTLVDAVQQMLDHRTEETS